MRRFHYGHMSILSALPEQMMALERLWLMLQLGSTNHLLAISHQLPPLAISPSHQSSPLAVLPSHRLLIATSCLLSDCHLTVSHCLLLSCLFLDHHHFAVSPPHQLWPFICYLHSFVATECCRTGKLLGLAWEGSWF